MIKKFFTILSFVLLFSCQNRSIPAVEDATLKVDRSGYSFLESPLYIVNADYVIYEDRYTHNIIYPDLASFSTRKKEESGFAFDKNGIYVKGEFLKIDTTGFVALGKNDELDLLWKTKNKVFKNITELKDIDVESFQANPSKRFISDDVNQYFKDKNSIYYFDKKIEGSDGASANTDQYDFCHDKNHIYSKGEIAYFGREPYQYVNYFFSKTKRFVFFNGEIVDGMHADSLTGLSLCYSRYKNSIYFQDQVTPMQLKKSSKIKVWITENQDRYITDGENVFDGGKKLERKFDIPSFGFLPYSNLIYDKNGVYEIVYDIDLKKDKIEKLPFKYTEKVSSANTSYNRFSRIVFYKNQAYAKETKSLYKDLTPKQLAKGKAQKKDIDDFDGSDKVVFDLNFYKKYDQVYCNDKRTGFDAETFRPIDGSTQYYKDKNRVLFYDEKYSKMNKLNDVDVKSARFFNTFLVDKNYLYCKNSKIIKSAGLELLAAFPGYRGGFCGNDPTPISDFYLFKNAEGFWLVKKSDEIFYRFLGKVFDRKWDPAFEAIDLAKKYKNKRTAFPQRSFKAESSSEDYNKVYNSTEVDVPPKFVGGYQKFNLFLNKNYKVPEAITKDKSLGGGVFANFIIEKDGSVSNIDIQHDRGYGSGKELERVLKLCPDWIPAMKNGKPVRCIQGLPYYIK
ncbi:DKNYY domain-containing protein [Flavobacterium sp. FlaQc-48]|uniref:DKNYY domain-containing protein n=1 Tax=Flavobacterium sp. FlaQc-48 TaxID=3374181 RepID=UPI003757A34E